MSFAGSNSKLVKEKHIRYNSKHTHWHLRPCTYQNLKAFPLFITSLSSNVLITCHRHHRWNGCWSLKTLQFIPLDLQPANEQLKNAVFQLFSFSLWSMSLQVEIGDWLQFILPTSLLALFRWWNRTIALRLLSSSSSSSNAAAVFAVVADCLRYFVVGCVCGFLGTRFVSDNNRSAWIHYRLLMPVATTNFIISPMLVEYASSCLCFPFCKQLSSDWNLQKNLNSIWSLLKLSTSVTRRNNAFRMARFANFIFPPGQSLDSLQL